MQKSGVGVMVLLAKKVNKNLTKKGRIEISHGSISSLPFADNTFDLITAFEAYYFWPDFHYELQEIKRIFRPDGTLLLVNKIYENEKFRDRNREWAPWADMRLHTPAGYREFLTETGCETRYYVRADSLPGRPAGLPR